MYFSSLRYFRLDPTVLSVQKLVSDVMILLDAKHLLKKKKDTELALFLWSVTGLFPHLQIKKGRILEICGGLVCF